jgi:VanZ family protein
MLANRSSRRWLVMIVVGLYWMLLFTLTHWPVGPERPVRPRRIPHLDKVAHAAAFAGLAFLACVGVASFRPITPLLLAGLLGALAFYAGFDEFTQGWVRHRTPDLRDWLADLVGMLAGVGAFLLARRVLHRAAARPVTAPAAG